MDIEDYIVASQSDLAKAAVNLTRGWYVIHPKETGEVPVGHYVRDRLMLRTFCGNSRLIGL
jgi:hypothetical protein